MGEAAAAAREATALVPMVERAPQGRRNRPGPGPDLQQASLLVMPHHHATRIAGQAAGRFRGNARAVFEDRLARLIRVGEGGRIDVDHDLIALTRGAGIKIAVEGRLREQGQRIRLLLGQARRLQRAVSHLRGRRRLATARSYNSSRAAASACLSSAPTSGSSRPRTTTMPSSS